MKSLIGALVAAILLATTVQAKPQQQPNARGGREGGGGNGASSRPITEQDVRFVFDRIEKTDLLRYAFNYISSITYLPNESLSQNSPLFKALFVTWPKPRIWERLLSHKPNLLSKGPCKDLEGKNVDASIHNTPPNTICFSIERLTQRFNSSNFFPGIIALAAHEYAHVQGLLETDANFIQTTLMNKIPTNLYTSPDLLEKELENDVVRMRSNLSTAKYQLEQYTDNLLLCALIGQLTEQAFHIMDKVERSAGEGLLVTHVLNLEHLSELRVRGMNLMNACINPANMKSDVEKGFEGQATAKLSDYALRRGWAGSFGDTEIHKLPFGPSGELHMEINQLLKVAESVQNWRRWK